jgi:hypothetical protein
MPKKEEEKKKKKLARDPKILVSHGGKNLSI